MLWVTRFMVKPYDAMLNFQILIINSRGIQISSCLPHSAACIGLNLNLSKQGPCKSLEVSTLLYKIWAW